jgi:20S proteasome subunit alpha 7
MYVRMISQTERNLTLYSIYLVHDDAKDKEFELELSWIGAETNWEHTAVPDALFEQAEKAAKAAVEVE